MAKIQYFVLKGHKLQVESAIRDGAGNNIVNTYATQTNLSGVSDRVEAIEGEIPSQASSSNQLADKNFVNSSINALAAFYITKNSSGDPFATNAELLAATTFYSGGEARVPTQNDYCIVQADETKSDDLGNAPTTRYSYQGGTYPSGQWEYQYIINRTALTAAQIAAINSGITATLVSNIQTNNAKVSNVQADWNATTGLAVILNKPTIPTIPTNISAFTNDSGYLTSSTGVTSVNGNVGDITNIATTSDIPTDNADLTNGAGYITSSDIPLTDVKVNNVSVVSSKVASITMPTKVSDLTNDSGFISSYNNQRVKAKNSSNTDVTFGANDVVEIKAGANITITPDSANKTITIAGASSTPTEVQVNGTNITSNSVANLLTNSAYSSTNKIATMNDIPSLTNYVTTNTTQTISGTKTFNAPTNVASTEQASMKINTSNGGSIIFGKEGTNSGTMIRLDQTDGTPRLRFRSSATAGAMVWEQPEQGAQLYIDLGKQSVDKHRVTFPSSAGTLALTSQIPSVSLVTTSGSQSITVGSSTLSFGANAFNSTTIPSNTNQLTNGAGFITSSDLPTSINGLSGGQLTSPLVIKGGDSATASKIILDSSASGQITSSGTQTLFGFTSNGATTLAVGHSSYALGLRGSGTRPKFNSNDVAMYSDLGTQATFSLSGTTLTITPK